MALLALPCSHQVTNALNDGLALSLSNDDSRLGAGLAVAQSLLNAVELLDEQERLRCGLGAADFGFVALPARMCPAGGEGGATVALRGVT